MRDFQRSLPVTVPGTISVGRRQVVVGLYCSLAAVLLAGPARASSLATVEKLLQLPDPFAGEGDELSYDLFLRLSQLVTGRLDLDSDVASKMHRVFEGEAWVRKHAETAYSQLLGGLRNGDGHSSVADLVEGGVVRDGEAWFVSHLLTTWYLGVYYHPDRDDVRITYDKALMHELLADYRPVPGLSDRETGFWLQRPAIAEEWAAPDP